MGASEPYQINPATAQQWYDVWYGAGSRGEPAGWQGHSDWEYYSYYAPYAAQGYAAGQQEYQQQQMLEDMMSQMSAAMHMPEISAPEMPTFEMPDYSAIYAEQQAAVDAEAARAEAARKAAILAESTAQVDREIAAERANARLLGIDYDITAQQRAQRIDTLATGGGPVTETPAEQKKRKQGRRVGATKPIIPSLVDEDTLGTATILG